MLVVLVGAQEVQAMPHVTVQAGPLPELLDRLAQVELRELLQEAGAPPEAVKRELALLQVQREQERALARGR